MSESEQLILSARTLYAQGRLPIAEANLQSALSRDPDNVQGLLLLGIILVRTRRFQDGASHLDRVVKADPRNFDALNWLALASKGLGHFPEALSFCERAIEVAPRSPAAYNSLGLTHLESGNPLPAVVAFKKAVELNPLSAPTIHNLGKALAASFQLNEALVAFKKAADLTPDEVSNYVEIYKLCELLGAWEEAKSLLEKGSQRNPSAFSLLIALANISSNLLERDAAEDYFKRALKLDPRAGQAYALWLQEEGRFQDSVQQLLDNIELDPNNGLSYYHLAEAKSFDQPNGSLVESAKNIESVPNLDPRSYMYLAYARGKAHETAKEFETAMACYDRANEYAYRIFNASRPYDQRDLRTFTDRVQTMMNRDFFRQNHAIGLNSAKPILIVGMIRSGTTLIDQIIASHPDVTSAGEQPFWSQFSEVTFKEMMAKGVDSPRVRGLGEAYLAQLEKVAGPSKRVTDKMPLNYEYLGLIHLAIPNAKIVHVKRNPLDTCLSIYTTHFGVGPPFGYSQRNIVDHYRNYLLTMERWRDVLPRETLYEIEYEKLVENPEEEIRSLIGFLDLSWSDGCLSHESSNSTILTPSRWQARQPIYRSSRDRWRRYEPWLGDLAELTELSS